LVGIKIIFDTCGKKRAKNLAMYRKSRNFAPEVAAWPNGYPADYQRTAALPPRGKAQRQAKANSIY